MKTTTDDKKVTSRIANGDTAKDPGKSIVELVDARIKQAVDARVAELSRVTPRSVFNGDDALFLSWMTGFVAGVHVTHPNMASDGSGERIFARCRALHDKLAPLAGPPAPAGGS
jgi:hypothetical protein